MYVDVTGGGPVFTIVRRWRPNLDSISHIQWLVCPSKRLMEIPLNPLSKIKLPVSAILFICLRFQSVKCCMWTADLPLSCARRLSGFAMLVLRAGGRYHRLINPFRWPISRCCMCAVFNSLLRMVETKKYNSHSSQSVLTTPVFNLFRDSHRSRKWPRGHRKMNMLTHAKPCRWIIRYTGPIMRNSFLRWDSKFLFLFWEGSRNSTVFSFFYIGINIGPQVGLDFLEPDFLWVSENWASNSCWVISCLVRGPVVYFENFFWTNDLRHSFAFVILQEVEDTHCIVDHV